MTNRLKWMMKKTGALLLMLFLSVLTSCYEDLKNDFQDLGSNIYQGYWAYDLTDAPTAYGTKLFGSNTIDQTFTVTKDTYIVGCRVKMNREGDFTSYPNAKIQVLLYEDVTLVQSISKYVYDSARTPEYIAPTTAPATADEFIPFEFNLRHKATSGKTYKILFQMASSAGNASNCFVFYTGAGGKFGLRVWGISPN